jgi:hypothetical protein
MQDWNARELQRVSSVQVQASEFSLARASQLSAPRKAVVQGPDDGQPVTFTGIDLEGNEVEIRGPLISEDGTEWEFAE